MPELDPHVGEDDVAAACRHNANVIGPTPSSTVAPLTGQVALKRDVGAGG